MDGNISYLCPLKQIFILVKVKKYENKGHEN